MKLFCSLAAHNVVVFENSLLIKTTMPLATMTPNYFDLRFHCKYLIICTNFRYRVKINKVSFKSFHALVIRPKRKFNILKYIRSRATFLEIKRGHI